MFEAEAEVLFHIAFFYMIALRGPSARFVADFRKPVTPSPFSSQAWAEPVLTRGSQAQAALGPTAHPHFPSILSHKQSFPTSFKMVLHHSYNLI